MLKSIVVFVCAIDNSSYRLIFYCEIYHYSSKKSILKEVKLQSLVIERWWRELHERLEKFFKTGLCWLKDQWYYDLHEQEDR